MKTHKAAFFGRNSPGPAGVGDEFGPKFEVTKAQMAMAMPFAHKTKLVWPGSEGCARDDETSTLCLRYVYLQGYDLIRDDYIV